MQSIWYGRNELLFGSADERKKLAEYTQKAILFAKNAGCRNLVFGSPRNRRQEIPDLFMQNGIDFFRQIADFAFRNKTVIALEANPEIYGTNYITGTLQAFHLARHINHPALMVNYDVGTALINGEELEILKENLDLVHHVHLSEPDLAPIEPHAMHKALISILRNGDYHGYISVEMKRCNDTNVILNAMDYLRGISK